MAERQRAATITGEWVDDALCAQTNPDAFFPSEGRESRDAKRICLMCRGRVGCLGYALANPGETQSGVWGGFSAKELQDLRKTGKTAIEVLRDAS